MERQFLASSIASPLLTQSTVATGHYASGGAPPGVSLYQQAPAYQSVGQQQFSATPFNRPFVGQAPGNASRAGGVAYSAVMEPQIPKKPVASPGRSGHRHYYHHHHHHSHQQGGRPQSSRTSPAIKDVALKDRLGRMIEIDSADEDDWDHGARPRKAWGQRSGPVSDRPIDDLQLTLRDLFPCLAPIFDTCGCARRKPRRILQRSAPPPTDGPRVEQVCLDCGNVLESRPVGGTVAIDMYDRGDPRRHQAFLEVEKQTRPSGPTFEGYENWVSTDQVAHDLTGMIELPDFSAAPARVLQHNPATATLHRDTEFSPDKTGHVELPDFPLSS